MMIVYVVIYVLYDRCRKKEVRCLKTLARSRHHSYTHRKRGLKEKEGRDVLFVESSTVVHLYMASGRDAATLARTHKVEVSTAVQCVAYSAARKRFVTGHPDDDLWAREWDMSGKELGACLRACVRVRACFCAW